MASVAAGRPWWYLTRTTWQSALLGGGWTAVGVLNLVFYSLGGYQRNSQDLWIGVPRPSSPAVSLTTLTVATVVAVVKLWAAPGGRPGRVCLLIFRDGVGWCRARS
jgi:hypothetical protein